ncbi:hypothetical protein B1H29_28720 [Streptomyces pactum]|uniref:Uncharacterized protein n=1 Tax=Streptomyces pactum TaxID=68249 RepID=A0A1S6JF56_9ACTN|nr:hypothetical protein B1H29_28720 [Streptomyces pactum]
MPSVEGPAEEQFGWELERFCELALRAKPNILECLHSPLVEHADEHGPRAARPARRVPLPPLRRSCVTRSISTPSRSHIRDLVSSGSRSPTGSAAGSRCTPRRSTSESREGKP